MSVDYYNCAKCGTIFSDHGDCQYCGHCHNSFCSAECAGFELQRVDCDQASFVNPECCICRCTFDDLSNNYAFPILLDVFGMSRETAIELIRGYLAQDVKTKS